MKVRTLAVSSAVAVAAVVSFSASARAQHTIVKNPNDHPEYRAELEPHGSIVLFHPGYGYLYRGGRYDAFGSPEFVAGFRATIEVADPAFIPKLNNTVGITFGVDITNCAYCYRGYGFSFWIPVGLQWNFFLTDKC